VNDGPFEAAVVTVVVAGGVALMWRTGGIDLPEIDLSTPGWLLVALAAVALAAAVVGVAARTSRPLTNRNRKNG
jgi:hypothetical protein